MWLLMTLLACEPESKDAMFGINTGGQDDTESPDVTVDTEDTGKIDDTGEPPEPEPSGEPDTQDCSYDDATINEDPNNLVGRAVCGEDFWSNSCSGCHGRNGEGTPSGQQLQGHIVDHSDADLIRSIVEGKGSMPAYDNVHPQMVADVVAYMRANIQ